MTHRASLPSAGGKSSLADEEERARRDGTRDGRWSWCDVTAEAQIPLTKAGILLAGLVGYMMMSNGAHPEWACVCVGNFKAAGGRS